jgi:hypothetical protein
MGRTTRSKRSINPSSTRRRSWRGLLAGEKPDHCGEESAPYGGANDEDSEILAAGNLEISPDQCKRSNNRESVPWPNLHGGILAAAARRPVAVAGPGAVVNVAAAGIQIAAVVGVVIGCDQWTVLYRRERVASKCASYTEYCKRKRNADECAFHSASFTLEFPALPRE